MGRELKHRGYSWELKKWVFGELYQDQQWGCFIIEDNKFKNRVRVAVSSVGHFMECYDKNGVPIYEYDIVDWERRNTTEQRASVRTTIYLGCNFLNPLEEEVPDNDGRLANVKVVGNYYENEELLDFLKNNNMNKADKFKAITSSMAAVYAAKNADYGDSFGKSFSEFGIVAPVVRISDKVNRIKQLIKHDARVKDESIRDTLLDLANYAVMTLIELQEEDEMQNSTKD